MTNIIAGLTAALIAAGISVEAWDKFNAEARPKIEALSATVTAGSLTRALQYSVLDSRAYQPAGRTGDQVVEDLIAGNGLRLDTQIPAGIIYLPARGEFLYCPVGLNSIPCTRARTMICENLTPTAQ